jgi:hypothetical protein
MARTAGIFIDLEGYHREPMLCLQLARFLMECGGLAGLVFAPVEKSSISFCWEKHIWKEPEMICRHIFINRKRERSGERIT